METTNFDTSKELFTVNVRAGKKVTRADIERVVAERAKAQELTYRVTWTAADQKKKTLAKRGASFTAPLLAGGTYDFSKALGGRPVVLTFWASWCAPCIEEAAHLQRLFETYGAKGVEFVAVSIDEETDYDKLRAVVAAKKLTYPVPLDPRGEVLAKYADGASIPLTFVIARSGEVTYRHQNFKSGDEVDLEAAITRELKAGTVGAP